MNELKSVEFNVLSINVDKAVARVKFTNPYKLSDEDEINIDHERDVAIPLVEGVADVDAFNSILDQLANAQSNKMMLSLEKSKLNKSTAFADLLKKHKDVEIKTDADDIQASPDEEMMEPVDVLPVEPEPTTKLVPSKTTPPKKTAVKNPKTSI